MLPFIIIRFEGFKIYRYSSEGLKRRKKLSVGMQLCLILFTSQQMTVFWLYFLPVFLYLQIESLQKNILKMVTFGCAERWLMFAWRYHYLLWWSLKNVQNPIAHLPQVITHTRVWSWSRHHNNLVIQPDQHTMGSASMAARTLAYSAISPITVQASYQAACTDKA